MKKSISLILAAALLFSLLPAAAFAEETQTVSARATPIGTWGWYSVTEFAGGNGSSEDPYLIATPEQLAHINVVSVTNKTYFSLTNDIDLSAHYWKSGMRFQGHFRGNGYTITGLNIQEYHLYAEASSSYMSGNAGLFSYVSTGATICDLNIQNPVVAVNGDSAYSGGNQYAGVVAGYCDGTITNVNVTGASVTRSGTGSGSNFVGGIVGRGGNLTGCRFSGTIRNTDASAYAVGGIAGLCAKGISSCTSSGSIEASNAAAAGGIAGELQGCSITDSYSTMSVRNTGSSVLRAGGIVGRMVPGVNSVGTEVASALVRCYATGTVYAESSSNMTCVGGLAGAYDRPVSITACYAANPSVSGISDGGETDSRAGRVVGYEDSNTSASAQIQKTYANDSISIKRTKYNSNPGCNESKYSEVDTPSNTTGNSSYTYSESFIKTTLGWGICTDVAAPASGKVWIYKSSGPILYTQQRYSLTIRYTDTAQAVWDVYLGYYAPGASYSVTSPGLAGGAPEQPVVSGMIHNNTYLSVGYVHEHIPGDPATCRWEQLCLMCGAVIAEKTPHPYMEVTVPADCVQSGYVEYTCPDCGDMYRGNAAAPLGHTLSSGNVCSRCGLTFTELPRGYTVFVYDAETDKPVADAEVLLGDALVLTDAAGAAAFQLTDDAQTSLKITKNGYPDYENDEFVFGSMMQTIIYLESSDTGIYEAWCNGDNVLVTDSQINCKSPAMTAKILVKGRAQANITKYELVQGDKVIASSTDGKFQVRNPYFLEKTDVYVRMHTDGQAEHNLFERKLNINVIGWTLSAQTDWGSLLPMAGGFDFTFENGTPLLSGAKLEIPAYFIGDNTKVGVEIGNEKVVVSLGISKDYADKDDVDDKNWKETLKKMRDDWIKENNPNAWPDGNTTNEVKVSAAFVFELGEEGVTSVYGQLNLGYELSYEYGKTFVVWVIPIYAGFEIGLTGELEVTQIGYDYANGQLLIPDWGLEIALDLTAQGGLGCSLISAGVYGSAGGELVLGAVDREEYLRYKIYGCLGIYGRIKPFFWKTLEKRIPLIYGEYYGPNGQLAVQSAMLMMEDYEPDPRAYLQTRSPWLASATYSEGGHSILQSGVSPNIAPRILTAGDTTMMVFLDDDGSEGLNYQHLYYSLYDKAAGTWAEPIRVDEAEGAAVDFDLFTDGSEIYLAYTKAGCITEENQEDDEAILSQIEVYAAAYSSQTGTFADHCRLSDNGALDTMPQIVKAGDRLSVAWISNLTNDVLGQNADNVLMIAHRDASGWQKPAALSEPGATVTAMDAGVLEGTEYIALIRDADCDVSTTNDRVLQLVDSAGGTTQVESAEGSCESVRFGSAAGTDVLQWYSSGNIWQLTEADGNPSALFADAPEGLTGQYKLLDLGDEKAVVLFAKNTMDEETQITGSGIYGIYYSGGQWGQPVPVMEGLQELYVDAFDADLRGEDLLLSYITTETTFTDSDISRECTFISSVLPIRDDLSVGEPVYLPSELITGDRIDVKIPVTNNAWQPLREFTVQVTKDGGGMVAHTSVSLPQSEAIGSGQTGYAQISVPKEALVPGNAYSVRVDAQSWNDDDRDNNSAPLELWYTDLAVTAQQVVLGGQLQLHYAVENTGNCDGGGVLTVYKKNGDETQTLHEETLDGIPRGSSHTGALTVDESFYPEGASEGTVFLTVAPAQPDLYAFNDTTSLKVGALERSKTEDITGAEAATPMPVVDEPYVIYDKRVGVSTEITVTENGWSFSGIDRIDRMQYGYYEGSLQIRETWLDALEEGYHYLTLNFSRSGQTAQALLILEVTDSSYGAASLTAPDQSVSYDAKPVRIEELTFSTNSGGALTATYSPDGGTTWLEGLPAELGQYTVKLHIGTDAQQGLAETSCTFLLTVTKGKRAISVPTQITAQEYRVCFGGAVPTAGADDGKVLYGYSLQNDVNTVESWQEAGILPPADAPVSYYVFARITGGTNYEDAVSKGCAVQAHIHRYESTVIPPTFTEGGYTLHTCSTCYDSYQDTFVDKLQGIRGDLNGDAVVDSRDAVYLLRHVLSPGKYPLNQSGDMNADLTVNEADAIRLLRYALVPSRYPLHTE